MGGTACSHLLVVGVEAASVVCLSVGGEELGNLGIHLIAVVGAGLLRHADAAVGLQGSLERLVGLEAYDGLLALVKVPGAMGGDGGDDFGVHVKDAAGFSFLLLQVEHLCPQILGVLCGSGKECLIAVIGMVVPLDEVADIDFFVPFACHKICPFWSHFEITSYKFELV